MAVIGLILAGGRGKRMESSVAKSMQVVAGKPMLEHILSALNCANIKNIALILSKDNYHEFDQILKNHPDLAVAIQESPKGTAHASSCASILFSDNYLSDYISPSVLRPLCHPWSPDDSILICLGDTPALSPKVIDDFLHHHLQSKAKISIMALELENPHGYGRIIVKNSKHCSDGFYRAQKIVEQKNATPSQQLIKLCFCGLMVVKLERLFDLLKYVTKDHITGEYYLTQLVELASHQGHFVSVMVTKEWQSVLGVNTPSQKKQVDTLMVKKLQFSSV